MPSVGTDNSSIFDLGNSLFVFLLSCCSVLEEDSKYLLLRLKYLFFHMRLPSRQFYCIIIIGYLMLKRRRLVAVRTTLSYRYIAKKALHWRVCSSWPSADKRRRLLLTAIACNGCMSNAVQHARAYASEMQDIGIQRTCAGMKLAKLHKTNAMHMLGSTKCALVLYCVLRYQQVDKSINLLPCPYGSKAMLLQLDVNMSLFIARFSPFSPHRPPRTLLRTPREPPRVSRDHYCWHLSH